MIRNLWRGVFRGLKYDGSAWVYGAVVHPRNIKGEVYTAIVPLMGKETVYSEITPVRPETVGQFTGLDDATTWDELTPDEQATYHKDFWFGRPIFEGDILEAHYDDKFPDNATRTVVVWSDGLPEGEPVGWRMKQGDYTPDTLCFGDGMMNRVIGNIHQNPELLEEVLA